MANTKNSTGTNPRNRPVRSYVLRQGRITRGQQRAMKELWPRYGLDHQDDSQVDFGSVFGRLAPLSLEIGFGDGEALLDAARNNPGRDYIGIEVHRPGVGNLLLKLEQEQLTNVRVFCADAIEVLSQSVATESLCQLNLFFPDPWPKKRHHKRRIVNADFIHLLATRLKPGGLFHFATDWQPYAEEVLTIFERSSKFVNISGPGQFSARPEIRPITKFERRGQRLGHAVWDILMQRL